TNMISYQGLVRTFLSFTMTDDLLLETLAQPVCIGELCIYCSPFSQFFSTDIIKKTRLKHERV
ncbi:hypothetical protein, partial [Escherichia coli]|uniref:hypothetical protein n=1 Tax=Escherichia coli TaxID=562 RepID=UPI0006671E0B